MARVGLLVMPPTCVKSPSQAPFEIGCWICPDSEMENKRAVEKARSALALCVLTKILWRSILYPPVVCLRHHTRRFRILGIRSLRTPENDAHTSARSEDALGFAGAQNEKSR